MSVVEHGTIAAAARALELPRPTVSRRLTRLEQQVGARLIERGTRRIVVTRTGQQLYDRIREPMQALASAERAIRDSSETPRGLLRVAAPTMMQRLLVPLVRDFQRSYPDVSLELMTGTRFADLSREGFDIAIRAGFLRRPDLIQRRLLTLDVGLFAAPDYLATRGRPEAPGDLALHTLLRGHTPRERPRQWWPTRAGDRIPVRGDFVTNDRQLLAAAAVGGIGIALLSEDQSHPLVRSGALEPVLSREMGTSIGLFVAYPDRTFLPPRSRVFVDAVVDAARNWPDHTGRSR